MADRTWQEASTGTGLLDVAARPAPTPVRRTATPNWHYASMRRAEDAGRSISVRRSVGSIPAGELEAAKAVQTSYYLLAAAHRSAGRKRERADRFAASRLGTLLRAVRSAVGR